MRRRLAVIRRVLDRPRLWRATAVAAAFVLGVVLVGAAQGSITVLTRAPLTSAHRVAPSWERWCADGKLRVDRVRLAYCARVDGIVVSSSRGPDQDEAHVALIGGFHLTLVKLPDHSRVPSVGTRLVAVGPLFRARDGQREVQAFRLQR